MGEVRTDLAAIRGEMATRADITAVRSELATNMGAVRNEMADFRRDMNQRFLAIDQTFTWLVGIQTAVLVSVIGALVGSYYR